MAVAAVKVAAAILAPAVFWIGYFYYKDRYRPEPLLNLAASFALGFVFGFLCYKFYGLLDNAGILPSLQAVVRRTTRMEFFSFSVVFIGLIEETFKYLPFVLLALRLLSAVLILGLWAWGIRTLERREAAAPASPAEAGPDSS
jgi:RsiW-degrading membrane proteinase PrsW (M82 family)